MAVLWRHRLTFLVSFFLVTTYQFFYRSLVVTNCKIMSRPEVECYHKGRSLLLIFLHMQDVDGMYNNRLSRFLFVSGILNGTLEEFPYFFM